MDEAPVIRTVVWVGSSQKELKAFPRPVQRAVGLALYAAQLGETPPDAKPLKGFAGTGVFELVEDEVFCICCHYALRTWNKIGKGSLDLHGHSHNMLKPLTRQYDVGVDAWDFTPVTLAQMRAGRRDWLARQRTRGRPPT